MSQVALQCVGLTKAFGPILAVEQLDLTVGQGQVLALLGPSGCGKTTTLRLIAGFERPDAGEVWIQGQLVSGPTVHIPPERRRVGVVSQDYALFPHLTVAQNVAYGLPRRERGNARTREVLSLVGLEGLESRMPHELSGGQQQRVALARALAPNPGALLLDEPFSNLDAGLRGQVREEVKGILTASGTTAIFVTHDQEEALFMGDIVAIQNQGHLEQADTPERIFHAPATQFVARFMGIADFLTAWHTEKGLETEAGPVPPGTSASPEGRLDVMVRPDDVSIRPSESGQGRIVSRVFQGAFYLYRVILPSGAVVHSQSSHTALYASGTRVEVTLDPGHPLLCFVNGRSLPPVASG